MQIGWRAFHHTTMDIAGLSAAWRFSTSLHAISATQRPGRSIIDRDEFNFYEVREKRGLKAAIEERDAPYKKFFPIIK